MKHGCHPCSKATSIFFLPMNAIVTSGSLAPRRKVSASLAATPTTGNGQRDIRLVGAPAESIGKFGGDTDNWEWPRHTGDFSVFRVYMRNDGKSAAHAADNVPY